MSLIIFIIAIIISFIFIPIYVNYKINKIMKKKNYN